MTQPNPHDDNMQNKNNDLNNKPPTIIKGILLTGSKQNLSKSRRVSWGDAKIKEFGKNDYTVNRPEPPNHSLNYIEEESSSSKDMSMSSSSLSNHIFDSKNKQNQRLTIQNLNSIMQKNEINNELSFEHGQIPKNNRLTIANLKGIVDNNNSLNEEENKENDENNIDIFDNKRYTLSITDAYNDLLKGKLEDLSINDENDSFDKENKFLPVKKHKNSIMPGNRQSLALSNTSTPRVSFTMMSPLNITNNKITLSDRKFLIGPDKKNNISDVFNSGNHNRITLLNPKDIFNSNSYSKKHNSIKSDNILLSPLPKIKNNLSANLVKIETDTVDQRLQAHYNNITEKSNIKLKLISELEKEISCIKEKQKEFRNEVNSITQEKNKIISDIQNIKNVMIKKNKEYGWNKFLQNFFGLKIITYGSVDPFKYAFDILLLKKIKISFLVSKNIFNSKDNFSIFSSKGEIINSNNDPFFKQSESEINLIQNTYNYYVNNIFHPGQISLFDFKKNIKEIIKFSASFLYMVEMINCLFIMCSKVIMKFEKEKNCFAILFGIINKKGFEVNFLFEIQIKDSFNGLSLIDKEIINYSLEQIPLSKIQQEIGDLEEQIQKLLQMKNKPKLIFQNFFLTLYENVTNL